MAPLDLEAEETTATAKPADPRRAPDVQLALKVAGRRDPHPDPLKPLGRVSLFIWVAMAATLYFAGGPIGRVINVPMLQEQSLGLVHGLTDSDRSRERTIRKIERSEHAMEVAAVTGFAAGTFLFAAYYALVYLVGMNLRRLTEEAAHAVHSGAQRIAAWNARRRARQAALKADNATRVTKAGPEPQMH